MLVSANWSFKSITDAEVKGFFNIYIPGAQVPNPDRLSGPVLDRVAYTLVDEIKKDLKGAPATLQVDGLKNI